MKNLRFQTSTITISATLSTINLIKVKTTMYFNLNN